MPSTNSLTKADIAEKLSAAFSFSKSQSKDIVDDIFKELIVILESGEQIKITGFGNFNLKDKTERPGRNPKTGEEVVISGRRVVTLRTGPKLKERLIALAEQSVST